jgi:hypothetical protein
LLFSGKGNFVHREGTYKTPFRTFYLNHKSKFCIDSLLTKLFCVLIKKKWSKMCCEYVKI